MQAGPLEVVGELLDARLVRDRRVGKRTRSWWLGVVLSGGAVNQVDALRLGVVGLEIFIGERPRRRDAAVVAHLAEVALAKAKEDRSVDLRVAAHVVLGVR